MSIKVGDRLPKATFVRATPDGPQPVDSEEFFRGRRVALFSVPGAFTPTCSSRHLPGFVEKIDQLREKGVDEVAYTAVNDAFVLNAWAEQAGAHGKVTMLADGNGDFADAIGLSADFAKFGMGKRGQRWSMIVNDGIVEDLNVDELGAFNVSSAEYLLARL